MTHDPETLTMPPPVDSDARQSVTGGSGREDRARSRPRSVIPIWGFTAILWIAGLALYFGVVRDIAPIDAPIRVTWWMLAIAFALTEIFVAHIRYREDAQTYSLSEVPLLVGLCFATPAGLAVGRLLGALIALTLHRRQSGLKLAFNLGLFLVLDACLAPLIFHVLLQSHLPLHPVGWAAAYATLMITDTVSGLAIALVTLLHQRSLPASAVRSDLVFGLVVAVVNVSFGLVTVTTLWYNPPAFFLLLVVTAIMVAAYRGYVSLTAMYERLQKLFTFTCTSADVPSNLERPSLALEKLREAVNAGYVELTLFDAGRESALRWRLDEQDECEALDVELAAEEKALLSTATVMAHDEAELRLRGDLERREITHVMIAPLNDGRRIAGSVLVGSRAGVRAFSQGDIETLQTLANHLAVTIKNARLMERLRAEKEEREHEALHDALTDLPNRRAFLEAVGDTVAECPRDGGFALILVDLAEFRQVNDTLGYAAGDSALVELAGRFRDRPEVTVAARLGGDEFAFLLPPPADAAAALTFAAVLRDAVSKPVQLDSFTAQLRANVGVVLYPQHGDHGELLLQRADMALHAAKDTPQGVALFRQEHDTSSPRRLALAAELEQAVARGLIEVAYQPQVDMVAGRVVGVEALARWCHPSLGQVSPEEFIPIAESTGAIWPLTQHVLRQALAEAGEWLRDASGLRLSLNLSVRCLHYPQLTQTLDAALREAGVHRDRLVLELTESSLMTDFVRFQEAIDRLLAAGFAVSIDDFGVGYSSLAYIRSLHAAEVKVDRAFVAELLQSPDAAAIVKSVIDLAHAVKARAVAEGVEDRSTLRRLRAMGCDVAQGFYLSRPLRIDALRVWLPENRDSIDEGWSELEAGASGQHRPVPLRRPRAVH